MEGDAGRRRVLVAAQIMALGVGDADSVACVPSYLGRWGWPSAPWTGLSHRPARTGLGLPNDFAGSSTDGLVSTCRVARQGAALGGRCDNLVSGPKQRQGRAQILFVSAPPMAAPLLAPSGTGPLVSVASP